MPLMTSALVLSLDRRGLIPTPPMLCMRLIHTSLVGRRVGSPRGKETRMTKTHATLNDVIRNSKHGFQQMDDRPGKPQKHRYERRKIRELLRSKDIEEPDSS